MELDASRELGLFGLLLARQEHSAGKGKCQEVLAIAGSLSDVGYQSDHRATGQLVGNVGQGNGHFRECFFGSSASS